MTAPPDEGPLVTIGLAVHNGEAFLAAALDSVLRQTHRNIEVLIGDNASTDGTEEICRRFAAADPRIRVLRSRTNRGAAWNFNRLVHEGRGEYFRWAAADDLLAPDAVARTLDVLTARPDVVLVLSRTLLIDADGNVLGAYDDNLHLDMERPSERFRELRRRLGLCNACYGTMRRSVLAKTGLFGNCPAPDTVLLAELALAGRIVELPERLFRRRFHDAAASRKSGAALEEHYGTGGRSAGALARPPLHLHEWGRVLPTLAAIRRSPIGLGEKVRATRFLARSLVSSRDRLTLELVRATEYWMRAAGPGPSDRVGRGTLRRAEEALRDPA